MVTQSHPAVVVQATGFVVACAYCCSRPQLVALDRAYPAMVSHAICPACSAVQNARLDAMELARKAAA